uniref:DUF6570 domain-containing protein n=1 Tax=Rhipicephalus zambeziensis TaxID=60191 RepID=A0A224YZQ9_9ACAR
MEATIPSVSGLTQACVSISPNITNVTSTQDKAAKRRARDAERKRLKRAADPKLRQREAALKRRRRAADREHRAREAALARERRAAGPGVRDREAQRKRRKRAAEPDLREREAARKRQQREAAPDAARERAAIAAARAKQHAQPDVRFKRDFLDQGFGHSCKVCHRLWSDNNLTRIGNIRNETHRIKALSVLCNKLYASNDCKSMPNYNDYVVCALCKDSLIAGRVPAMSVSYGYRYPPRPDHLPELNTVEERLIAPRLPFMSIRRLTHGNGQNGIKGQVVNVPDDAAIDIHIKRRLVEIDESTYSSTCPGPTQEVQAESSRPSKRGVDVAVGTPRISDHNLCKSSQASVVPVRIHRWTETSDLEDLQDTAEVAGEPRVGCIFRGLSARGSCTPEQVVASRSLHDMEGVRFPVLLLPLLHF